MATALGLALKITADVGGINTAMSGVEKAFQQLGTQADAVTGTLEKFASGNQAAADAQKQLATDLGFLVSALKTGQMTAQEFAADFDILKASAADTAAIFAAGASTTAAYATESQKAAASIAQVESQFKAGAISVETYESAIAKLSGATAKSAEDAAKLASAVAAGAATTARYATDTEKAAASQAVVNQQYAAGTISAETLARATADLSGATAKAAEDAAKLASAMAAGASTTARYATDAEKAAASQAVVNEQLAAGTITAETAARATADLSGANAKAAEDAAKLASAMAAGAATTAQYATDAERTAASQAIVNEQFAAGTISAETLARATAELSGENAATAAAAAQLNDIMTAGAATTAKYAADSDKNAAAMAEVQKQFEAGAISITTYNDALAELSGANAEAEVSAKAFAKTQADAERIMGTISGPIQAFDSSMASLQSHLDEGRISQEAFDKELGKITNDFVKAQKAAEDYGRATEEAGGGDLQLNELSGALGLLPGPLGSVASKFSSAMSAGEGLAKVFGGGDGIAGAMASVGPIVEVLTNKFVLIAGAFLAVGAAAAAVSAALDALSAKNEKLTQIADKSGASFEFIQVLGKAAENAGSSVDSVSAAFTKTLKAIDSAKTGSKESAANFALLGITMEDLKGKNSEQIFKQASDALLKIEDPAKRAAAAMGIFGKAGADLIPTLQGVAGAGADMAKFQATLSELDKTKLATLDASMEALKTGTEGLGIALVMPFAGLKTGITDAGGDILAGIIAIVKPIGQVLEPLFTGIGRIIATVGQILGGIGEVIGTLLAPFGELAQLVEPIFTAIYGVVVSVIDAFFTWEKAVAKTIVSFSPIGVLVDILKACQPAIDFVVNAFNRLAKIITASVGVAIDYIGKQFQNLYKFFTQAGDGAGILGTVIGGVVNFFGGLWELIKSIAGTIGSLIDAALSFAERFLGIGPVEIPVEIAPPEKGSGEVFQKELEAAGKAAAEFGQEGFAAMVSYQKSLEDIAAAAEDADLTAEQLAAANARATAEFTAQIDVLKANKKAAEDAAKAQEKLAEENRKVGEAAAKAADDFMRSQGIGGTAEEAKNKETLVAVNRAIADTENALAEARKNNDAEGERALVKRLALLDQGQKAAQQQDQFGFTDQDATKTIEKVRKGVADSLREAVNFGGDGIAAAASFTTELDRLQEQLDLKIIDPKQFEEASKQAQELFNKEKAWAKSIFDAEAKYAEELMNQQDERVKELATVSKENPQANDVRTTEGAALVMQIAQGGQDPAIEEYRKQLKKLDEMKKELAKIRQSKVEIR